jgi:succinyl-diaminopimelate desuccinylase
MTDETLELAMALIRRPSVTPQDAGCQTLVAARLERLGFTIHRLRFGEVDNLWATHGSGSPLLVFAGHTDVVPPGPRDDWASDPFEPVVRDGRLYGRGAADMKSSVAAFVTAAERYAAARPAHPGTLALLLTSDEEGPAVDGTVKVLEWLERQRVQIDYCVVGEPTSSERLGDTIKHGRRGSLSGRLVVRGIQGHVAYPQLARNPIHQLAPALAELAAAQWDHGDEDFPPTSFQVSNIHGGTGADNVIPGEVEVRFNFRFSPAVTEQALRSRVEAILARHGIDYRLEWTLSGRPYLTRGRRLVEALRAAIRAELGVEAALSTSGGTSDGRFIAATGAEVVEFGPLNTTIHKVNEHVSVEDPARLARVYLKVIENIFE